MCMVAVADAHPLVDKWLIVSYLRKILGAKRAEDYKHLTDYQRISDQAI